MREITEIQKRLEKVSLDLKQSQDELRELSGKLAELERNLDKKSKPVETVQKNEKKNDSKSLQIQDLKIYTGEDVQSFISKIDYSNLLISSLFDTVRISLASMNSETSALYNWFIYSLFKYDVSYGLLYFCARVYNYRPAASSYTLSSQIIYAVNSDEKIFMQKIFSYGILDKNSKKVLIYAMLKITDKFITDKVQKTGAVQYIARIAELLGLTTDDVKRALNDTSFQYIDYALK